MISFLIKIITIAYGAYIFLNTNVFYDYLKIVLRWTGIFSKYEKLLEQSKINLNFPDYLKMKCQDKFVAKLFSCPICITFWSSVIMFKLELIFVGALFSYIFYKLLKEKIL